MIGRVAWHTEAWHTTPADRPWPGTLRRTNSFSAGISISTIVARQSSVNLGNWPGRWTRHAWTQPAVLRRSSGLLAQAAPRAWRPIAAPRLYLPLMKCSLREPWSGSDRGRSRLRLGTDSVWSARFGKWYRGFESYEPGEYWRKCNALG